MSSYALLAEKTSGSDTDDTTEDFDIETSVIEKSSPWNKIDGFSKHWIVIPIGILLLLFSTLLVVDIAIHAKSSHQDVGVKECRNFTRTYGMDLNYMSLDPKYDYLWDSELAGNNGIIELPPYANDTSQRELGAIGMFHQIHCLTAMRKTLQRARAGEDIGIDHKDDTHWPHCFHYLREAILCAADDTVERPRLHNGTRKGSIEGALDVRHCGNSEALYALRAQHGLMGKHH